MSRISLRETYDNRSVIAQIAKVTDTAEDAAETVEQKAAEINDALTDVNAAVTTANAASAAAQQSAQTVAGYENRLGAVEGDIVTIQGRVTAIEGNYLKKSGDPQTVVSQINVPTTITGVRDTQIANGTRIQNDLDAYTPMVRTTDNQTVAGLKVFTQYLDAMSEGHYLLSTPRVNNNTDYIKIASWTTKNYAHEFTLIGSEYNTRLSYAKIIALGNIDDGVLSLASVTNVATVSGSKLSAKLTWNGTEYAIYVKSVNYHEKKVFYNGGFLHNNRLGSNVVTVGDTTLVPEPVVGDTFLNVVDMVEMT